MTHYIYTIIPTGKHRQVVIVEKAIEILGYTYRKFSHIIMISKNENAYEEIERFQQQNELTNGAI